MATGVERKKVLIWGKTRPEISAKYKETVCTGAVCAATGRLLRLYPIPQRYLSDQTLFKKYRWHEIDLEKSTRDPRPESWKVHRWDTIVGGETIGPDRGTWKSRAGIVLNPRNLFASVEELKARQSEDGTSLGIVRPSRILRFRDEVVSKSERDKFWQRYRSVLAQRDLFEEDSGVNPIPGPERYFFVDFECDDATCKGQHKFKLLDWEVDALYHRQRREEERSESQAAKKVIEKLEWMAQRDFRFFLGNIYQYPGTFTVAGLWYPSEPPSESQGELFA